MKRNFLFSCCIGLLSLCSCESNNVESRIVDVDIQACESKSSSFMDEYSGVEVIPLENQQQCMISRAKKMVTTQKGFTIFDYGNNPIIYQFDKQGQYLGKVGDYGHGRGEYQQVFDIAASSDGSTVVVSSWKELLMYVNRKFVKSENGLEGGFLKSIQATEDGYVCESPYSSKDYLLHFYNKDLKLQSEMIETGGNSIGTPPSIFQSMVIEKGKLYYCNYFESSFNVIDLKQQVIKKYCMHTDNMISVEKAMDRQANEDKYEDVCFDEFMNFHVKDGVIKGQFIQKGHGKKFEMNTKTDSFYIIENSEWRPIIFDAHDGYDYTVISQTEFLDIINPPSMDDMARWAMAPKLSEEAKEMFKEAYANLGKEITEDNNFVILKLKKK